MRDAVTVCYAVRLRVFTVTVPRVIAVTALRVRVYIYIEGGPANRCL